MERRVGHSSVLAIIRAATAALVLGLIAIADLTLNLRSEVRFAKVVVLQANVHRLQQVTTWGIFTRRAGKLYKTRSRLYRSQISQINTTNSLESSRRDLHNTLLRTTLNQIAPIAQLSDLNVLF